MPVSGPGNYGPVTATVTAGGSYYWIASYSGDANNNPVAGACGAAGETSVVRVLQGALNVTKAVSPVAGGGTVIEFGDTLTYTLTVSATGELTQNNVVVSDYIPGYDPARPTSGKTTYVAGSAACIGGGNLHDHPARCRPQDHLGAGRHGGRHDPSGHVQGDHRRRRR